MARNESSKEKLEKARKNRGDKPNRKRTELQSLWMLRGNSSAEKEKK